MPAEWIDFSGGRSLRVNYEGTVLVLRNNKEKRFPWTVVHLNDEVSGYHIGMVLSDEYVKDWWKLSYLKS